MDFATHGWSQVLLCPERRKIRAASVDTRAVEGINVFGRPEKTSVDWKISLSCLRAATERGMRVGPEIPQLPTHDALLYHIIMFALPHMTHIFTFSIVLAQSHATIVPFGSASQSSESRK